MNKEGKHEKVKLAKEKKTKTYERKGKKTNKKERKGPGKEMQTKEVCIAAKTLFLRSP